MNIVSKFLVLKEKFKQKLILLLIAVLAVINSAAKDSTSILENEIIGEPDIECLDQEIRVWVKTKRPFQGRIYAKGKADDPACFKDDFGTKKQKKAQFDLGLGMCGMKSLRSYDPRGMYYGITVVISFHPLFITKGDQAFHVKCFFEEANRGLTAELGVSMIPTTEVEARHGIPIHKSTIEELDAGQPPGTPITFAKVGDKVLHQWHCDDQMYGVLINNCYVTDGVNKKADVIDNHGCPIDPILITGIRYSSDLQRAYAESQVFKFADRPGVWFFCQIQPPMCPISRSGYGAANNASGADRYGGSSGGLESAQVTTISIKTSRPPSTTSISTAESEDYEGGTTPFTAEGTFGGEEEETETPASASPPAPLNTSQNQRGLVHGTYRGSSSTPSGHYTTTSQSQPTAGQYDAKGGGGKYGSVDDEQGGAEGKVEDGREGTTVDDFEDGETAATKPVGHFRGHENFQEQKHQQSITENTAEYDSIASSGLEFPSPKSAKNEEDTFKPKSPPSPPGSAAVGPPGQRPSPDHLEQSIFPPLAANFGGYGISGDAANPSEHSETDDEQKPDSASTAPQQKVTVFGPAFSPSDLNSHLSAAKTLNGRDPPGSSSKSGAIRKRQEISTEFETNDGLIMGEQHGEAETDKLQHSGSTFPPSSYNDKLKRTARTNHWTENEDADHNVTIPPNLSELLEKLGPDEITAKNLQRLFQDSVSDRRALLQGFDLLVSKARNEQMRGDGKSHKKLPLKRLDHSLTVGALSKSKKNQTIPGNNRKRKPGEIVDTVNVVWDSPTDESDADKSEAANRLARDLPLVATLPPQTTERANKKLAKASGDRKSSQQQKQQNINGAEGHFPKTEDPPMIAGQLLIYDLDETPPPATTAEEQTTFSNSTESCPLTRQRLYFATAISAVVTIIMTALTVVLFLKLRRTQINLKYSEAIPICVDASSREGYRQSNPVNSSLDMRTTIDHIALDEDRCSSDEKYFLPSAPPSTLSNFIVQKRHPPERMPARENKKNANSERARFQSIATNKFSSANVQNYVNYKTNKNGPLGI